MPRVTLALSLFLLPVLTGCLSPEEAAVRDARRAAEEAHAVALRSHAEAQAALAQAQDAAAQAQLEAQAARARVEQVVQAAESQAVQAQAEAVAHGAQAEQAARQAQAKAAELQAGARAGSVGAPASSAPKATWPAADPADVGTIEALVGALYDVISGPAGAPRDWSRMASLFHPSQGRLMPAVPRPDGSVGVQAMTPDDYRRLAEPMFQREGFFERERFRIEERYGDIAHVFSTYETRREVDGDVWQRGINSLQLLWDGSRWWVLSITWSSETDGRPLPERYLG